MCHRYMTESTDDRHVTEADWLKHVPIVNCKVDDQGPTLDCSVHAIANAMHILRDCEEQSPITSSRPLIFKIDRRQGIDAASLRKELQDRINSAAASGLAKHACRVRRCLSSVYYQTQV